VDGRSRRGRRTAGQSKGDQVPGHKAATTVRAGAGARALPEVAQPVAVVASARAVYDNAVEGPQPEGVHKRGRRQARDSVEDSGEASAHQVGPVEGLQYTRGDRRAVRRLFVGRQRVLLRQAPEILQLGNYNNIMLCTYLKS